MKYANLTTKLQEQINSKKSEVAAMIMNGYKDEENPQYNKADYYLERYSTPARWYAYKEGRVSRERAVELATARAEKSIDKDYAEYFERLNSAASAGTLESATISIEWRRSRMWGNNPTATLEVVWTDENGASRWANIEGSSVGGCGYDKESTAAAQVLEQSPAIMRLLYDAKEAALNNPPDKGRLMNPFAMDEAHEVRENNTSSNSILGYGSGYGILPYFEGGVGVSCFRSIFERLGYKWECVSSGKTFDVYRITKA